MKLLEAILSADSFRSFPANSGYSSLNPRIADGSIPIKGSSLFIIPDNNLNILSYCLFCCSYQSFGEKCPGAYFVTRCDHFII